MPPAGPFSPIALNGVAGMERFALRGDTAAASMRVVVIPWGVQKDDSTEAGVALTRCALVQSARLLLVFLGLPGRQKASHQTLVSASLCRLLR